MPDKGTSFVLKSLLSLPLLLLPSLVLAQCELGDVIFKLRPKAEWNLNGTSYEGLVWLDRVQTKPSQKETETALTECTALEETKERSKETVANSSLSDKERLNALVIYLGL